MKEQYTREQKIVYWARTIAHLEIAIERLRNKLSYAKARLEYIQSDKYQDWNSDLQAELAVKKAAK